MLYSLPTFVFATMLALTCNSRNLRTEACGRTRAARKDSGAQQSSQPVQPYVAPIGRQININVPAYTLNAGGSDDANPAAALVGENRVGAGENQPAAFRLRGGFEEAGDDDDGIGLRFGGGDNGGFRDPVDFRSAGGGGFSARSGRVGSPYSMPASGSLSQDPNDMEPVKVQKPSNWDDSAERTGPRPKAAAALALLQNAGSGVSQNPANAAPRSVQKTPDWSTGSGSAGSSGAGARRSAARNVLMAARSSGIVQNAGNVAPVSMLSSVSDSERWGVHDTIVGGPGWSNKITAYKPLPPPPTNQRTSALNLLGAARRGTGSRSTFSRSSGSTFGRPSGSGGGGISQSALGPASRQQSTGGGSWDDD